jgi:hypothetical protein
MFFNYFLRSTRQRVLNENNSKRFRLTDAVYSSLFATIAALGEMVIASTASVILYPSIALASLYKTYYFDWKNYKYERNKNLTRKTLLATQVLTTGAEVLAVSAGVAAYFGTQLLAAPIISALFVGAIGGRFLSHFAQTIYHGYQWACAESCTKKNEKHKAQFWNHLRATVTLGVMGAVVGFLMFTPAFHLLTLSAGAVVAVKAAGATLLSCNSVKLVHSVYESHQQKKQNLNAWRKKRNEAQKKRREIREELEKKYRSELDQIKPGEYIDNFMPEFIEQEPKFIGDPLSYDKTRADFNGNPRLRFKYREERFKSLKDNDVDDLIRALEASDDEKKPKQTLLDLLKQSTDVLVKDLGMDPKKDQVKLNENGQIEIKKKKSSGFVSYMQAAKRFDKLQAVLLLQALVEQNGKKRVKVQEKDTTWEIGTVHELLQYLRLNKKSENVFHSFLLNGKVQKLFTLSDYYLRNTDLHPESRLTYEKSRLMYAAAPAA